MARHIIKVGVGGFKRSGKDSYAQLLEQHVLSHLPNCDYKIFKHSRIFVDASAYGFAAIDQKLAESAAKHGIDFTPMTAEEHKSAFESNKERYRHVWQGLGDRYSRGEWGEDFWAALVHRMIGQYALESQSEVVIAAVTDLRFENEYKWFSMSDPVLDQAGFLNNSIVNYLIRPGTEPHWQTAHASEKIHLSHAHELARKHNLNFKPIPNGGDLETLSSRAKETADEILAMVSGENG